MIRSLLFGMTGFGNNALKALDKQPFIKILGVFTPKREVKPFPYYECNKLQDLTLSMGIDLYEGLLLKSEETYQLIKKLSPDLIVVSNFKQIIPESIISIPKIGVINVHPSLLPKYRGATPTVWAVMNDERETGITVHFIENEEIDCGRIITQAKLIISHSDTDGTLRYKLAELSEKALRDALHLLLIREKETFPVQNGPEATYFPKRTLKDAEIDLKKPFKEIKNKIRAMSPYPGACLKYRGKKYIVKSATLLNSGKTEEICKNQREKILVNTIEGMVEFQILT